MKIKQRSDYTFKYNNKLGRHGWLRLTPAYSVKLVEKIIDNVSDDAFILDPFSGTATTGLVAAEHHMSAHCFDINPFLIWLGNAKCRNYTKTELDKVGTKTTKALVEYRSLIDEKNWLPDIHNITRWWCGHTLKALASLRQALVNQFGEPRNNSASSLVWIAFCRLVIETSSAAFNHVSMSFNNKTIPFGVEQIEELYIEILDIIFQSAEEKLPGSASVHFVDSRKPIVIDEVKYNHVVTSPPYPNRISYVRELRPYMYWTKFLNAAHEAGELDWKAIGGTWGVATSRLQGWESNSFELPKPLKRVIIEILESKKKNALLMANYVGKYFHDMHLHFENLRKHLKKGATLNYIVGNSSFYGVRVHTEKLLENSLISHGFTNVGSKIVRKRNSKKELFEYCVYATWKENRKYKPTYFDTSIKQEEQLMLL